MKNNPFKSEQTYGLIFIMTAIVTGFITGLWLLSFLLWSLVYILWKWVELYYFYKWYKNGADKKNVPLNYGVWEELCSMVIYNKNQNLKVEKKNKYLLKQFDKTAQALPYATILLNQRFEINWVNHAAQQILGVIQNQDEGIKIDNFVRDPAFIAIMAGEDNEIKIPHPNDKQKKIHIKLIKLLNKRYLLVARDISEQESLRKSRKAFVANASHELRTPLTVITGYLEMLFTSDEIPKSWKSAIDQAMQQSSRMEKIIDDMLKLSSIEHEKYLEDSDDVIEMPAVLNRLFNDVKNSSKSKQHFFIANIDSELRINGNEEEVISICLNLLNNAVIHTRADTNISLRWFKQDDKAQLWICDDGEGIDIKHLPHLTERFYRADNTCYKNVNSTGLGLAIVKQICDNHNAKLDVESELGKGTCFKVEFPSSRVV
ncbi:MAG: phosphate regulon sensor histidine kinase PhoR [Alcanivoracaceae bacterium]|nr:phosphate regulon sensor histidine kinase PhoR [Alcanivoracaceae bacterium]